MQPLSYKLLKSILFEKLIRHLPLCIVVYVGLHTRLPHLGDINAYNLEVYTYKCILWLVSTLNLICNKLEAISSFMQPKTNDIFIHLNSSDFGQTCDAGCIPMGLLVVGKQACGSATTQVQRLPTD